MKILARSILVIVFLWLFAYVFLFLSMPSAGRDIFHGSIEKSKKYGLLVAASDAGVSNIKLSNACVINIDKIWIERSDVTSLTWYLHIKHTPGRWFGYNVQIDDNRCYGIHKRTFSALEVDLLAKQFQQADMPYQVRRSKEIGPVYMWASSFLDKQFVLNVHLRDTNLFYRQSVDLR